ncbi:Fanconi anemia group M protein homolog [Zerene cesonia]|uniref:Fanconi anemia group M protein homolog n=1 Tax=Zerene cesonia TaxID=33412 RepID=UPI0018E53EF3|nr:Fanconi anemia group M protein homolog [Zerene cesonia]
MNKTFNNNIENGFDDDEIFDDSAILANFDNSAFKDETFRDKNSNKSSLNISALCCDEEISGYDRLTGKTWVYPTNYPVRDYQFNIIRASILKNTLVSLPTGLGKTFIAAVIMYNFYRWYPLGKIVFTAPTRPLVAQQIEACYNIVALPPKDTIEMTGHMHVNTRKQHWKSKRVFFATPQVIYNDMKSGICPGDKIRCLVIDEAHRARGNYAYCQIISTLNDMGHKTYRILALSATPGSKVEDVINVVKNLNIAHLELRSENCIDVAPYSHSRKINTVIIQLGPELTQLRQRYVEILDSYARRLKQFNILPQNLGNLSKGRIVMLYKEFQTKERGARHPQHNIIMKDFTLLIALYHGLELLIKHGSRVFLNFFDEHPEKSWIQSDDALTALLERLRDDLGINPLSLDRSMLPDGTVPEMPKNLCFGHPKFHKLKEIMMDHFQKAKEKGQDTRAIVFCEYRESVNLVHCLLLQCRPLIVPQMFVGQGASGKEGRAVSSQKQQLRVMRAFRSGGCNALVCTCVAEEGLDVGGVDLILCFDVSTRSPVRLVQRCGRTGRERGGQVHILVTEGREHQTLIDCMRQRDGLNDKILQSKEVESNLYKANPRMIPHDFMPECHKMHITVAKKNGGKDKDADGAKKGQKDIKSMLCGRTSTSNSSSSCVRQAETNELITEEEFNTVFPEGFSIVERLQPATELWSANKESIMDVSNGENKYIKLSTWLEWQRTSQQTVNISHSVDTDILTSLLQCSDAKRFDAPPSTQNPTFNTQDFATQNIVKVASSPVKQKQTKRKVKVPLNKSPNKRDGDIRALFSTATKSTKNYTKLLNDLGVQNDGKVPTSLINLLVDLNLEITNSDKKCFICSHICDCKVLRRTQRKSIPPIILLSNQPLNLPDLSLIDEINIDSILKCAKRCIKDISKKQNESIKNISIGDHSKNFDLEFDFNLSNSPVEEKEVVTNDKADNNFDIGDIEDIFENSSPDEGKVEVKSDLKAEDPKNTLGFFGLDSIDDIFADSDDDAMANIDIDKNISNCNNDEIKLDSEEDVIASDTNVPKPINDKGNQEYNVKSPSILSGRLKNDNIPTSPILCSQARKFQLSTKKKQLNSSTPVSNAKKKLILEDESNNTDLCVRNEGSSKSNLIQNVTGDTSNNKSMLTITQLVEMINSSRNNNSILKRTHLASESNKEIDDRSSSPILMTQQDISKLTNNSKRSRNNKTQNTKHESLIILDSDSDSDDVTQEYSLNNFKDKSINLKPNISPIISKTTVDMYNDNKTSFCNKTSKDEIEIELNKSRNLSPINNEQNTSPKTVKRKFEDDDNEIIASPYFNNNKKQKLDATNAKSLSLREKVLAALSSNKFDINTEHDSNVNFVVHSPKFLSQKENKNPNYEDKNHINSNEKKSVTKNLEILQQFRKDSKLVPRKINFMNNICNRNNGSLEDSDDDFVGNDFRSQKSALIKTNTQTSNYKVRKKNRKANEFLDLEAEVSGEESDSASDSSVGSLEHFLCEDEESGVDMLPHYLQSVKSPVKGVFKIPALPKKFNNEEIFSQFVEEDSYEMDSFCVDSHIGLTQANDMSELEVAEMLLEEKRRKRKAPKKNIINDTNNGESPLVRKKFRKVQRLDSDSDDSS